MAEKLIISFEEYTKIVEKLAVQIYENYKPTVLVGIMRGAAPILDILSRILKLPIAYIVIQSYSGKGLEDQQGQLMFAREISSLAQNKDFNKVLLIDDLSDTGLTLNKSIEWLKNYAPTKDFIKEVKTACLWKKKSSIFEPDFCSVRLGEFPQPPVKPITIFIFASLAIFKSVSASEIRAHSEAFKFIFLQSSITASGLGLEGFFSTLQR